MKPLELVATISSSPSRLTESNPSTSLLSLMTDSLLRACLISFSSTMQGQRQETELITSKREEGKQSVDIIVAYDTGGSLLRCANYN